MDSGKVVAAFGVLAALSCASPLRGAASSPLTVYHLNPASAGAIPVNMDTGDAPGDLYFYLGQFLLPLECKNVSARSRAHFDCDNPERVDPNLVVTRVDMEVDEDTTTYSACNLCNGTDPFSGKSCQKGTYICDCEAHHGGGASCDPTKVGISNVTEHFAPRVPSQTCNSTLYNLCGDTTTDKNKCYDCLKHNWLKITFQGHCKQEDLFNFCPSDWSECRSENPKAWSCWSENLPRKTGGFWYSTLASGQNKSWTVQSVKTIKEQCLKNHLMDTVESHDSKGCFKACGARNTSDACWIGCFFDTLLGQDARRTTSLPLGGMSQAQIEKSWTGAFDTCAPIEVPLTWSNPSPSELRSVPSMRVASLRDRLALLKSRLRSSSPSPNAQCEEIFDQKQCDGGTAAAAGRKLLGGGGGGGCTWCKSTDGAHAECFYKSAAKALSKDWSCDN